MCTPWGATLEMSKEIISVKVEHTLCSQSTRFLSPPPPHYDPDFMFQPRGHHEILKRGRSVLTKRKGRNLRKVNILESSY